VNPLGIDVAAPHLSWQSNNSERNWRQAAYEILVASRAENLEPGSADVWDSGRRNSSESVDIPYAGPQLRSKTRYYWTVRVWDSSGQQSRASEIAWWEMGLLAQSDWQATWISWNNPEAREDREHIRWIWMPGEDPLHATPQTVVVFQATVKLRSKPEDAALFLLARGDFVSEVNGHRVGGKKHWHEFDREDITDQLQRGKNRITVSVTVTAPRQLAEEASGQASKAALAGLLKITRANGSLLRISTGSRWKSHLANQRGWRKSTIVGTLDDQRFDPVPPLPQPAALLRRVFEVTKPVRRARAYVSALGAYRIFLNGQAPADNVLAPGFSDYSKHTQYQTYDLTSAVKPGKNVVGVLLGAGWFASGMTWQGVAYYFQAPPCRLLAQLEITYTDGSVVVVTSDESWRAAPSPILHSEIYSGELYDARNEIRNWDHPDFDDSGWAKAEQASAPAATLVGQIDEPPRVVQSLTPVSVAPVRGAYVFDMGQNMVGWARLEMRGAQGTRVRMRFAERLNPDGSIYTENLRNADATDTYVLRGAGVESFAPSFTFHGFRYVEVTEYPGTPGVSNLRGEVVTSVQGEPTAKMTTSSELVNRMWEIGIWGQRGNFLSIPTDCPQRDERLGWMGDAGVFWRTGSFNFDIDAFSHKFMQDVADAQTPSGAFTNVSPDLLRPSRSEGAPGWADAGVIIPWTTWLQYGDRGIIEQHWQSMQRFLDFILRANPDYLRKNGVGPNFADWLAPDDHTDKTLLATAYWALVARMMSDMASATGRQDDARRYSELFVRIRDAFDQAYIKPDGQVGTGTQTSYVVALYTEMAPADLEPALVNNLVKDIEARGWHLSTGFLGTPFLLTTLADHARLDVAYHLLLNTTYPSWGYMLANGATTWWERWNGDSGDPAMNSFNHYAFGSVVAWLYRYVVGIDTLPDGPGFRHILIHPRADAVLTRASGEYESIYGTIRTDWRSEPGLSFSLRVHIPPNTFATIYLPALQGSQVLESGTRVSAEQQGHFYIVEAGSGSYAFEVK
jgi:alpha-L-rhamnosidase